VHTADVHFIFKDIDRRAAELPNSGRQGIAIEQVHLLR
jgi:hypothetical protein